ncbi:MAG: 50S ribosomal protein L37e [Methanophagales archaeon]|nr:50S ribosomal protein L37e [Methanophagales archaeon]RJS74692.1 MAG: 50S ribosomal protein L37e [Methanophagales archaeon]
MVKGTASFGKKQKRSHIRCRRCGSRSFSLHAKYCVACGFGRSKKMRKVYGWKKKKP